MNILNKSIQKIHKISGLVIAIFFLMWFVSGIVLLYHKYPKVDEHDTYSHAEVLDLQNLPSIYDIPGMTDTTKIKTLSVSRNLGNTVWTISAASSRKDNAMDKRSKDDMSFIFTGDTLIAQKKITPAQIDSIACLWAASNAITKVDTLKERQQWILYDRFEKSLPILRYHFDNPDKTEIFISMKNGEVVQASTQSERFWAYLGAIPHKFYISGIRTNTERWKTIMLIGGLICLIAALSGMYIGIYYIFINKKKHHTFASPFKKRMWRYHHIAGLIFGIFLIGWGISGALSTQRIPKWMVDYEGDYTLSATKLWSKKPLKLKDYKLDYRKVFDKYSNVKSISWQHFGSTPAYLVISGDKEYYVDASQPDKVKPLEISKKEIEKAVRRYFGDDADFSMVLMEDYDEYYLSAKGQQPLPVWKIEIDNEDGSRIYICPSDGYVKYLNENRMVKKWLFSACHYLDIKYFVLHNTLRYACLWILAIGCVFVIVTGVAIFFSKETNRYRK
ncbi:MAG: PepSY domain-containing protein [Muribaculum sp.]|nr:PepSY domain-containing protein [Muribaculum sp.]